MKAHEKFNKYRTLVPRIVDNLLRTNWSYMYRYRLDLIQDGYEMLLILIERDDKLTHANFSTYAFISIRRGIIRKLQELKENDSVCFGVDQEIVNTFPDMDNMDTEIRHELEAFVEKLSPNEKIILQLFVCEGISIRDVRSVVGRNYEWVRRTAYDLKDKLYKLLMN